MFLQSFVHLKMICQNNSRQKAICHEALCDCIVAICWYEVDSARKCTFSGALIKLQTYFQRKHNCDPHWFSLRLRSALHILRWHGYKYGIYRSIFDDISLISKLNIWWQMKLNGASTSLICPLLCVYYYYTGTKQWNGWEWLIHGKRHSREEN